jgi:hypothetical protein
VVVTERVGLDEPVRAGRLVHAGRGAVQQRARTHVLEQQAERLGVRVEVEVPAPALHDREVREVVDLARHDGQVRTGEVDLDARDARGLERRALPGVAETGDRSDPMISGERDGHRERDLAGRARDEDAGPGPHQDFFRPTNDWRIASA